MTGFALRRDGRAWYSRRPAGLVRVTLQQPPAMAACRAFSSSLADGLERRRRGATGAGAETSGKLPVSHAFPAQARPTRAGSRAARRGAAPSRPTSPARAAACPGGGASRATTTSPSAARARRRTRRTRPAGSSTSTPAARPTRRSATSRRGKRPRGRRRRRPGDRPCSTCFGVVRGPRTWVRGGRGSARDPGCRAADDGGARRGALLRRRRRLLHRRRSKAAPSRSPPSVGRAPVADLEFPPNASVPTFPPRSVGPPTAHARECTTQARHLKS